MKPPLQIAHNTRRVCAILLVALGVAALTACGGGFNAEGSGSGSGSGSGGSGSGSGGGSATSTYTIGGTVSGLLSNQQVYVQNGNGSTPIAISANGPAVYFTSAALGSYVVNIASVQPASIVCTAVNAFGAGVQANVTNVNIICSPQTSAVTVGGSVTGLASGSLIVTNNGSSNTAYTLSANGSFTLPQSIANGSGYALRVLQQPSGQVCSVAKSAGAGVTKNVVNILITCSTVANSVSVGGQLSGWVSTSLNQLVLSNGYDTLSLSSNARFTFTQKVALNGGYNVTINQQPSGQICTVSKGMGYAAANVTTVRVTCITSPTVGAGLLGAGLATDYLVGGTVNGLSSQTQVTVISNGDPTNFYTATSNGSFTLPNAIAADSGYSVSISNVSGSQNCDVTHGSVSAGIAANVSNVEIDCSASGATIGGSVAGLSANNQVVLINGGDTSTAYPVSANGSYQFPNPFASDTLVDVSVLTQPAGQTCTVSNPVSPALRTAGSASYNANVNCSNTSNPIWVMVSGLPSGASDSITMTDNDDGNDALPATSNGSAAFAQPVATGANYSVSVVSAVTGITCGAGPVGTANGPVTVNVNCTGTNGTFASSASIYASTSTVSLSQAYGSGTQGSSDGSSNSATANAPQMLATDGVNLYFTDTANNMVRAIQIASGTFSTVAGTTTAGASDGIGTAASFNAPTGITTDGSYLYIGDSGNCTIRRIEIATQTVSTIAGTAGSCALLDGTGTQATFQSGGWLNALVLSSDNSTLYIADNATVRMLNLSTGVVSTIAGQYPALAATDGVGVAAAFGAPIAGMSSDGNNLYITTSAATQALRAFNLRTSTVTTLAAGTGQTVNGFTAPTSASINAVIGLTTDGTYVYFTNGNSNNLYRIHADGSDLGAPTTLTGSGITLNSPAGLVTDGQFLYSCNTGTNQVIQLAAP